MDTGRTYQSVMIPDGTIKSKRTFGLPVLQRNLTGWKMAKNYIRHVILPNNVNFVSQIMSNYGPGGPCRPEDLTYFLEESNMIFTGLPYCSYMSTTEKYKILSPYRSLIRRNSWGEALYGIFVSAHRLEDIETKSTPKFNLIITNSDDGIDVTTTQTLDFIDFVQEKALTDNIKSSLKIVETELNLKPGTLIKKIQALGNILINDNKFLEDMETIINEDINGCLKNLVENLASAERNEEANKKTENKQSRNCLLRGICSSVCSGGAKNKSVQN